MKNLDAGSTFEICGVCRLFNYHLIYRSCECHFCSQECFNEHFDKHWKIHDEVKAKHFEQKDTLAENQMRLFNKKGITYLDR